MKRGKIIYSISNLPNICSSCIHSQTQTLHFISIVDIIFWRKPSLTSDWEPDVGVTPAVWAELDTDVSCTSGHRQAAKAFSLQLQPCWTGTASPSPHFGLLLSLPEATYSVRKDFRCSKLSKLVSWTLRVALIMPSDIALDYWPSLSLSIFKIYVGVQSCYCIWGQRQDSEFSLCPLPKLLSTRRVTCPVI